ncbi:subclass B3 metallo-beta-lactamase [Sphingomonas sabuli]|uniref:Subclass B3 metallo-beta-lactamase n=2 Tax=Sphingomonas sabuli TaxID=2764186 RepID=A0A7G9L5W1_9SPHN|nr:subclass B3 metallo-beta-lactamase [Sphingomonas sabuli]
MQVWSVPLGKPPPQIDRPSAPLKTNGPAFAAQCKDWDEWEKPAPPVRLHANTYLVGTCGIAAILITGNEGHILIDGGTEVGAPLIAENISRLGFKLRDVRIILQSHEHYDHVGGIGRLQQLTGAQVYASRAAAKVLETGVAGADDPQAGMHKPFRSARVDHVLADGVPVRLGNLMLTPIATPGHSPGALSWHWGACDGGVCRRIVYADSLSPISRDDYRFSDHPAYVAAYRAGLARLAAVECDILATPHPSASAMVERLGKASIEDPQACAAYASDIGKKLDERLAKERLK